jgi:hypothetical protein
MAKAKKKAEPRTPLATPCPQCPLRKLDIFRKLSEEELAFVSGFKSGELTFKAGNTIFSEGTNSPHSTPCCPAGPSSTRCFIHEYRLTMPVGIDEPGTGGPIPVTMERFGMRGTPTSILVGRDGAILHHGFGQEDDMALGARIASALAAPRMSASPQPIERARAPRGNPAA